MHHHYCYIVTVLVSTTLTLVTCYTTVPVSKSQNSVTNKVEDCDEKESMVCDFELIRFNLMAFSMTNSIQNNKYFFQTTSIHLFT